MGLTRFEPVTLERGLTHDTDFEDWANAVWSRDGAPEVSLTRFRKDVAIELMNEAGQIVLSYRLYRCWPSEYQALPDLDAAASTTAIERLVLQNEGWERDRDVKEPVETE
jgi:phage tail-like protein